MRKGSRRGMTLVELLVASAILVIIIAAVGYVYTQASQAVAVTQANVEINAKIRAVTARLREDLQAFTPDGFLIIVAPGPDAVPGANPPGLLMFTATGRFESRTRRDGSGRPVTANAALIVYVPARASNGDSGDILCRYVYLLTGDDQWPLTLLDLAAAAASGDRNALDGCDVLGESLFDLRRKHVFPVAGCIRDDYLDPVLLGYQYVNPAPVAADDPIAGGVEQLWPYLVGGCVGMDLEYCDGLGADGVTPEPSPMAWFSPAAKAGQNRKDRFGFSRRVWRDRMAWMCWHPSLGVPLPIGVRVRLHLQDEAGRVPPRTCEISVAIRR